MAGTTKIDRAMEDKMFAVANDAERVAALSRARAFKRSWIDLAEALTAVCDHESWKRWGFDSFEAYCRKELHLKPGTVHKLLGTYSFLRTEAPRVIERSREPDATPTAVPSLDAVRFVARAADRGAADDDTMREIRRAAFDEGAEAPLLSRRFKEVAFPVSEQERTDRLRSSLASTARRMANLIAEPDSPLPRRVAVLVEEAMGAVLEQLDH